MPIQRMFVSQEKLFNEFSNFLYRCDQGYLPPYCAPDPSITIKEEISSIQLNANLSLWSDQWGHEKCPANDERFVFAKVNRLYLRSLTEIDRS